MHTLMRLNEYTVIQLHCEVLCTCKKKKRILSFNGYGEISMHIVKYKKQTTK